MFPKELRTFDNADENGVKQSKRPYETSEESSKTSKAQKRQCWGCGQTNHPPKSCFLILNKNLNRVKKEAQETLVL